MLEHRGALVAILAFFGLAAVFAFQKGSSSGAGSARAGTPAGALVAPQSKGYIINPLTGDLWQGVAPQQGQDWCNAVPNDVTCDPSSAIGGAGGGTFSVLPCGTSGPECLIP